LESINSITFAPGEVSKTIAIPLVNDRAAERDETFTLQVSMEGSSESTTATCTIVNDDGGRGRAVRH
jgi:endoglucanase